MTDEAGPSKAAERNHLYDPSLDSQREVPLFHESRLGDLIDDAWTVPRLLEAAMPSDPGQRDIPGLDGELGPFPFHVNQKELALVRKEGMEFMKVLKARSEDHLLEVLDEELEYHMTHEHGLIMDQILLGDGIKDIAAASRSFVRDKFSDEESTTRLRDRLREKCLEEVADPDSTLGRKAHKLVHNLNDLCVDLGERDKEMRSRQELIVAGDSEVVQRLGIFPDTIEDPEAQQSSKVAKTNE